MRWQIWYFCNKIQKLVLGFSLIQVKCDQIYVYGIQSFARCCYKLRAQNKLSSLIDSSLQEFKCVRECVYVRVCVHLCVRVCVRVCVVG